MSIKEERLALTRAFICISDLISTLAAEEECSIKEVAGFLLANLNDLPRFLRKDNLTLKFFTTDEGQLERLLTYVGISGKFGDDNSKPSRGFYGGQYEPETPMTYAYIEYGWFREEMLEFLRIHGIAIQLNCDTAPMTTDIQGNSEKRMTRIEETIKKAIDAFPIAFSDYKRVVPKKTPHVYDWLENSGFAKTSRDKDAITKAVFEHFGLVGKRGRRPKHEQINS